MNTDGTPRAAVVFARSWARTLLGLTIVGCVLFLFAGDLGWWDGWLFLGVVLAGRTVNSAVLSRVNPGLSAERSSVEKPERGWDGAIVSLMGMLVFLVLAVAGLDERFGFTGGLPEWTSVVGLALVALGDGLFLWALVTNRFFSRFVKVQQTRGHHVVTAGPYSWVRHPGYLGWLGVWLGLVLLLDSPVSLGLALLALPLVAVRTVLEERLLRHELEGYERYAERVRHRLVPMVW